MAYRKPEEKQKKHITTRGFTTITMGQRKEESYVWTDNKDELLLDITLEYEVNKTQERSSDASCPECSSGADVHLFRHV